MKQAREIAYHIPIAVTFKKYISELILVIAFSNFILRKGGAINRRQDSRVERWDVKPMTYKINTHYLARRSILLG